VVSEDAHHANTKSIIRSIEASANAYGDVRVFNLSFGRYSPLAAHTEVEQREILIALRDLDNLIFGRDLLVIVAAGNSPPGVQPATQYPDHVDDPQWALGAWTMGFNTLTCGAAVSRASPGGLARQVDWPSPFSRIGPGVAKGPTPEFCASGGDCTPQYQYAPTLGVWVCRPDGLWEDRPGTSYAAPILAREAAFALQHLAAVCVPTAQPFGVTAKAFLALTARAPSVPPRMTTLAERTLGRGFADTDRLLRPAPHSAVMVWQGILESDKDIARVQLPIPLDWLHQAKQPELRFVCSWDPPVHDAALDIWACRRVVAHLKPTEGAPAVHGSRGRHSSYPMIDRSYNLRTIIDKLSEKKTPPTDDVWIIELSYEEIAEYYPGSEFSPRQRVAFAAELIDTAEEPVSPQAFVQKLPIASTMVQLGAVRAGVSTPVLVKVRR
jgi:hypothetical protein